MSDDDEEPVRLQVTVLRLRDKAVLVTCDGQEVWLPRSQMVNAPNDLAEGAPATLDVRSWLAEQKGLTGVRVASPGALPDEETPPPGTGSEDTWRARVEAEIKTLRARVAALENRGRGSGPSRGSGAPTQPAAQIEDEAPLL